MKRNLFIFFVCVLFTTSLFAQEKTEQQSNLSALEILEQVNADAYQKSPQAVMKLGQQLKTFRRDYAPKQKLQISKELEKEFQIQAPVAKTLVVDNIEAVSVNCNDYFDLAAKFAKYMNPQASNYLCGKLMDTMYYYSWQDEQWLAEGREVYSYDDNGYIATYKEESFNTTDSSVVFWEEEFRVTVTFTNEIPTGALMEYYDEIEKEWVPEQKLAYTFTDDIQVATYAEYDYNKTSEEWVGDDSLQFAYDANGHMTEQWIFNFNTVETKWDTVSYEGYTFNAEGYKTHQRWYNFAEDGTPVLYKEYTFDLAGWAAEAYYKGWQFMSSEDMVMMMHIKAETEGGWMFDPAGMLDYDNGLIAEKWEKTGFDPVASTFGAGNKYQYVYTEINPFDFDESVREELAYGELRDSYTRWLWADSDGDGNMAWEPDSKYYQYSYNEYGRTISSIRQTYREDVWVDSIKDVTAFTSASFDCNGNYMGQNVAAQESFLDTTGNGDWASFYRHYRDLLLLQYGYEFPADYYYLIWDPEARKFNYGNGRYQQLGGVAGNSLIIADNIQYAWDYDAQDWYMVYSHVRREDTRYNGKGKTAAGPGYRLEKQRALGVEKFDTLQYDYVTMESSYYKYVETAGNDMVVEYVDSLKLEESGLISEAYSGPSTTAARELMAYNAEGYMTLYHTQNYNVDQWVNVDSTVYVYTKPTDPYVGTAESANFVYSQYDYSWNGAQWDTTLLVHYGDNWDIWMPFSDGEYQYDKWYYDQEFAFENDDIALKQWDSETERWQYQYKEVYDYSDCKEVIYYLYMTNTDDGRALVNEEKTEGVYDCNARGYTEYDQYIWQADAWVNVHKEIRTFGDDGDCGYDMLAEAIYEFNPSTGEMERVGGFEEDEVYDDQGRIIEEWRKEWNGDRKIGLGISGWRNTYSYTEDGYPYINVDYNWGINDWVPEDKYVMLWSGVAGIKIVDAQLKPVTCQGGNDGMIDLEITGGTGDLTYTWNSGAESEDLASATEGVYWLTVTDENGCEFTSPKWEVPTIQPEAIVLATGVKNATSQYAIDGEAWVEADGGVAPYSYVWNDRLNSVTDTMFNATPGSYLLVVTDDLGCTATEYVYVNYDGATGLDELLQANGMAAYPNPSTGDFTLSVREDLIGSEMTIFRSNGSAVHVREITSTQEVIKLEDMDAGIYLIRLVAPDDVYNSRIIIK